MSYLYHIQSLYQIIALIRSYHLFHRALYAATLVLFMFFMICTAGTQIRRVFGRWTAMVTLGLEKLNGYIFAHGQ